MQDRIKEIRDRVDKATNSPWEITANEICECPLCQGEGQVDYVDISGDGWVALAQTYGIGEMVVDNSEFIKHSPSDIKYLLAALQEAHDRERALREALLKILEQYEDSHNCCCTGCKQMVNVSKIAEKALGQEGK